MSYSKALQYIDAVLAGDIPACTYIKQACQRHLDDLAKVKEPDYPYYFDDAKADRICKFIQLLPHTKGKWVAKRELITLELWQCFAFAIPFGWLRKKNNARRYREVYCEVPRKNGKSIIAAGTGLYCFAMDNEYGAEVYSGATSEKQAWEVFRPAKAMVINTPDLKESAQINVNAKNMNRLLDGGRFEPVIGNPGDGASPSCALIDEYHEHKTSDLYDTMRSGMGAREQPLLFVITTAGSNIAGPCYEKRQEVINVLNGVVPNEELWGLIYTIDEGDDWTQPEALKKANPNYGVSVFEDYLLAEQSSAVANAGHQNPFKTKHLNIWVNAREAWINLEDWKACEDKTLSIEDFVDDEAVYSFDLAYITDIFSTAQLFTRIIDGIRHYYVFSKHYLPSQTIFDEYNPNHSAYQRWVNDGYLIKTPGAEIDFNRVKRDICDFGEQFSIREMPYDPYGAVQLAHELDDYGFNPVKIPQKTTHLSPAMKELEAAIQSRRLHHDGHPVLTWMMSNVTVKEDANENIFPRKDKKHLKIDGAVALIMTVARSMVDDNNPGFVDV
ncbi:terminase large subunit [Zooshikella ganghwensis]|uniref:Terminase large subunit n=2 Tax=Zooshikella ganghwensis TaxID=202772 RepID=A0A4P9VFG5_9GAMM|nr:terminase TerL endonuclease subunit [Zooshikella ganghwensis]RDH41604.1 terminase large subunit [Zooshikella ganghwensis]RDH41694.1 terminase large subunit [Zooshikella ganghwensis]RDH41753.1 terminase large subunit [Zooshikella ganghwensis]